MTRAPVAVDPPPAQFGRGTCEQPKLLASAQESVPGAQGGVHVGCIPVDDVAQIVHDLKNPLSTIGLEVCLLEARVGADAAPALARITHNLVFLDRMVHELLDLAASDAGLLHLRRRPTELRALLREVVDRCVATRDRARVVLEAPVAIAIAVDDARIQRVVANLLQNALKYSPRGTEIVLELERRGNTARVSVSDAGPGVAPSEARGLFDKFRRADSVLEHDGNGLGLYISKRIMEAHGGRIGVDASYHTGSRFFFELPIDHGADGTNAKSRDLGGLHVLLVDDDINQISALAEILAEDGIDAEIATSGHEALELIEHRCPDAILFDAQMPEMSGATLIERAHERHPDVPAILMTAWPADDPKVVAAIAAADGWYVPKPVDVQTLLALLARRFLAGARSRSGR